MVLLDRGIFDAMAWIHLLEDDGKIDEDIRKAFTNFLRLDQWKAFVRQVFFFTCSPDTSLSREQDEKLTRKHGLVTQPNVLTRLSSAYEKATDCYKGDFRAVIVNTENSTAQAIAYKVVKDIFDTIDGTR